MPNPRFRLFDTHSHFFTDDTAHYPADPSGAREGRDAMLARLKSDPATAERVLGLWDACGVAGGAAVQYNTVYKTDNRYTIHVADAYHNRVSAVLILNAAAPETPDQLRALAGRHNVSGLRLFGYPDDAGEYPWLDSPAALKTWDVAAEMRLCMVLMYAPGKPSFAALRRIAALARRYPGTLIALDHCGWPGVEAGVAGTIGPEHVELVDLPNVHFKFTQINFNRFAETRIDPAEFVKRMADTYGAGRLMWGSDFGNTKTTYPEMAEQAIAATRLLPESDRHRVLHDNGARLFGDRLKL
ncbi:amidohydrolase [Sphingomonas psychrotolerans]|uniref:Amidohydrolase n=1 Tax=Sphingomonas psychrotolerans TaxID=1327635 RepID=A0ABU3N9K5_9SPHN|nr:amidohydrolase family protein [Sphingomonas psychrotolerans]MDT8760186.1 amidohydrolase [Sphingomonas psychrotolerans]